MNICLFCKYTNEWIVYTDDTYVSYTKCISVHAGSNPQVPLLSSHRRGCHIMFSERQALWPSNLAFVWQLVIFKKKKPSSSEKFSDTLLILLFCVSLSQGLTVLARLAGLRSSGLLSSWGYRNAPVHQVLFHYFVVTISLSLPVFKSHFSTCYLLPWNPSAC